MGILNKNVVKKVMALALVGIALSGCQKKDEGTAIQLRASSPRIGSGAITPQTMGISFNGKVHTSAMYQNAFNDMVRNFMSASMDPNAVGYVSATHEYNTGVDFGGSIMFSNGSALPYMGTTNGTYYVSPNSAILVHVRDLWQNRPDLQGLALPYTYLPLDRTSQSYVQGNQVLLRFSDTYQVVELRGTIVNQMFSGVFHFKTVMQYNGTPGVVANNGSTWQMGDFSVPACQFFQCQ